MPQWVDAPPVTPDLVARGVPAMSAGGGKEIHFDSSALRAQYDSGGTPQVPVTDPSYVPEIVTNAPSPAQLAESIPADVLKAMANGGRPSDESLRALMQTPQPVNNRAFPGGPVAIMTPFFPQQAQAVELTIPVGNDMIVQVRFTGQPRSKHWKRLIRHLEIEADADNDVEDADEKRARLANEAIALAQRIDLRADTAPPEPQPARRPRKKKETPPAEPSTE